MPFYNLIESMSNLAPFQKEEIQALMNAQPTLIPVAMIQNYALFRKRERRGFFPDVGLIAFMPEVKS